MRGIHEEIGDVSGSPGTASFPVRGRVAPRRDAAQVLLDVAARDGICPRSDRRDDAEDVVVRLRTKARGHEQTDDEDAEAAKDGDHPGRRPVARAHRVDARKRPAVPRREAQN
jgi:hypothetical protein